MRLVLDTAVVVAAFRSGRGASRQLLLGALDHRFETLISVPLMLEYEAVLCRPEHLDASGLSSTDVGRVLDALATVAKPVRLAYIWRPQLQDPGDEMVLDTAVNGSADGLVTFNRGDFGEIAADFGVAVMLPAEAWKNVQGGAQ